jgi:hypothetical protein
MNRQTLINTPYSPTPQGGQSMTKAELIEQMAKDAGISKAAANKALDLSVDGVNPNAA